MHNDLFYVRVLASADLGLGESYMLCDIEVSDLKGMMDVGSDSYLCFWANADFSTALARQLRRDDWPGFHVEQAQRYGVRPLQRLPRPVAVSGETECDKRLRPIERPIQGFSEQ